MTLKGLQLLRCIGCLFVLQAHINRDFMVGFFSLDIFFIISAFVMAMIITKPTQNQVGFMKGRIARVLPLYWSLTLLIFALALLAPSLLGSTTADPVNLFKSLFFIPYYKENGLIDPILAVAWTLNYEILFYVFCTLSFFLRSELRIAFVSAGMLSVYAIANTLQGQGSAPADFYSQYFMLEFPMGMMIWVLFRKFGDRFSVKGSPAFTLIAGLLAFMIYADLYLKPHMYLMVLFAIPSALVVWLALFQDSYIGDGPLTRLAMLLGDASYSIYLTHVFIIEAIKKLVPRFVDGFVFETAPVMLLTAVLCIVAGILVDRWFDKPAVKGFGDWLKARRFLPQLTVKT